MKPSKSIALTLDLRVVIIILVLVIIGMLAIWQPWTSSKTERKISVNGTSTIQATPDEFTFSPYFQRSGTDTTKMKAELDTFGKKLLEDVKKLGISEDNVTLSSSGYGKPEIAPASPDGTVSDTDEQTVMLSVTIKTGDKTTAQKVQDYLATTDAEGTLTSQPSFSQQKQRQIQDDARDKAISDAKAKAERSAKNLGVSVGKVIEVKESSTGGAYPLYARDAAESSISSLPVTPGKQDVTSTVEVVFEIK